MLFDIQIKLMELFSYGNIEQKWINIDFKLKPFHLIIPSAQSLASFFLFLSIILSGSVQFLCLSYNCQGESGGLKLSAWISSKATYSWREAAVMKRLSLFLVFAKVFSFGIYFDLIIFRSLL